MTRSRFLSSQALVDLRRNARWSLFAAAVLLLAGGAMLRSQAIAEESASSAPPPLPVEVVPLSASDDYRVSEQLVGRVVARRASELGFERSGRLVEVLHDQGDVVEEGAVLARLDVRELRAQRRELVAQRARIDAELKLAGNTTKRQEKLYEEGVTSSQGFDEAVYAEGSLAAQRSAATAAIERVDVQLTLSELRAPFAGTVAARLADEGTVLQPGAPVMELLETSVLEVQVGVPPSSAARLATGSTHRVDVEGIPADAKLHTILPTVDPDTRTVTAVFRISEAPAGVRHGALARVALDGRVAAEGFWLPLAALAEGRRGLWTAYVVVDGSAGPVAERRQVEVIHAEAERAFVRGTLTAGDRVVATGVHRLVPGMRVRPMDPPEPSANAANPPAPTTTTEG